MKAEDFSIMQQGKASVDTKENISAQLVKGRKV
jgi:hypothetical protein